MGANDTEMSIAANFIPKQEPVEDGDQSLIELNDSIEIHCPASLFKRHDSLAELSFVAATEKEALEREDSMNSDNSLICSQGFEISDGTDGGQSVIQQCAIQEQNFINITPTKLPEMNNDPLTPTANLKILMSVVSPAIRDLEEKRKDLCLSDEVASNVVEEVIIGKPVTYSRKDKSLGLLCHRFLEKFPDHPEQPIEICLDEVSRELQVERRRVYDIVNVLESVEILSRIAKNRYLWYGKTRIAQTLGKLKVLSRSNRIEPPKKQGKKNTEQLDVGKGKMKRSFSSGDMPRARTPASNVPVMKEDAISKEEERQRMKAIIESTDYCRKEKSLGVLSQKFLIMFLISKGGVVTLEDAANVLLDEKDDGNVKYKTKVRRLYDIANILTSLNFIVKVHIRSANGKKPGFKWIGDDIDTLPENEMTTGAVMTFKTKHSLLPEPSPFVDATFALPHPAKQEVIPAEESCTSSSDVRWAKSMSCGAGFPDWSKPSTSCVKIEQKSDCSDDVDISDGFPVREFDSSPVPAGQDVAPCSPTEAAFLEDLRKLRAKYPNRMSQLMAALPFNQPTGKTSRRNLFKQSKSSIKARRIGEPSPKKFRAAEVSTDSIPNENIENQDPDTVDNQMKFMHSTDSPFKLMPQTCDGDSAVSNAILCERQQDNVQTMVANNGCCTTDAPPCTIKLVDQAVSPIAPGKLAPARASVAIQASLIKNLSPLKPLMCVRQRVPSPWTIRTSSPAPPIPPPSTPELPGELLSVPFQSRANAVYLRSVSPYAIPASQSCGSSPVAPFTGMKQVLPCSTSPNVIIPPGNLVFQMNQVVAGNRMVSPTIHSHSCPPSVNPSPISLENTSTSSSPGITTTMVHPNNLVVNLHPVNLPTQQQYSQILPAPPVNTTPVVNDKEPVVGVKLPCEAASNALNTLNETPSNESLKDNVSRRLCLVNENS